MIIILLIFIFATIFIRKCENIQHIDNFEDKKQRDNIFKNNTDYVFICHSTKDNVFWDQVMKGVRSVAESNKLNVDFFYAEGKPKNLGRAIEDAVKIKVKGIAVVLPYDDDSIKRAMKNTTKNKIPVVVVNYGIDKLYNNMAMRNIIGYIGQIETLGAKSIVHALAGNAHPPIYYTVFYDEAESGAIRTRFTELVKEANRINDIILVDKDSNAYEVKDSNINTIIKQGMEKYGISFRDKDVIDQYFEKESKYERHVAIYTIHLTNIKQVIDNVEKWNKKLGTSKYQMISYDRTEDMERAFLNGTILAMYDQQPFIQGYMSINMLSIFNKTGEYPTNEISLSDVTEDPEDKGIKVNAIVTHYRHFCHKDKIDYHKCPWFEHAKLKLK